MVREKTCDEIVLEAVVKGVEEAMRTAMQFHGVEERNEIIEGIRDDVIGIAAKHANYLAESYKELLSDQ